MKYRLLASSVAAVMMSAGAISPVLAEGWYSSLSGGTADADISRGDLDAVYSGVLGSLAAASGPGYSLNRLDSDLDTSDSSWGVDVGYQWGSHFAVEVGYVDLGEAQYDANFVLTGGGPALGGSVSTSFRTTGPTVGAVGILPLGEKFEVHGRAGVLFSRIRITERLIDAGGVFASAKTGGNDKDLFAGVGGGWNINQNFSLRVDYRRFLDVGEADVTGERDVDQIALSILFR